MILGDSIGVGIFGFLPPGCLLRARVGRTSLVAAALAYPPADEVLISLGSNDAADPGRIIRELRARLGGKVAWVMPWRNREAVWMASEGDRRLVFSPGPDGVHPLWGGYRALAQQWRDGWQSL